MKALPTHFLSLLLSLTVMAGFIASPTAVAAEPVLKSSQAAKVLDISVQSTEGRIAAAVTFSAPVKGDVDLDQWLSIETALGERVSGSWVLDKKATTLFFTNVEPEQSYTVNVAKGLPFASWELLAAGMTGSIKIKPIEPMLGFAGNGNLLANSLTDGLPVISVNVGNVDVDFYRIPQAQIVPFLTRNTRRGQQEFWRIESFINKLELVYTARFDLKLARNQTATSFLPVKEIAPLQQQGVYVAIMRKSGEYRYSHPATWFAISDLGVHLRMYPEQTEVSVNSLATAQAKGDVTLRLLDKNGKELAKQQTTDEGTASFAQSSIAKAQILVANQGDQTTVVRLFGPLLDLSEFPVAGIENTAQHLFFYSERDLYRPGEAITVSALLRDSDAKLLPEQVISFALKQPNGRVASEQRLQPNALGYYQTQWQLSKDAATGQWSVSAQIPGQSATSYKLQVEDFLPERMELTLESAEFLKVEDEFKVKVNGQYLYGAPAANNVLQTEIVTRTAAHPFKKFAKYHFSNPQSTNFNRRTSLSDKTLNSEGELDLKVSNYWKKSKTPMQLKLYTSLLDSGGRPVSRIASSYALPADSLVGIKPLFEDDTAPYDAMANFELVFTNGESKLSAQDLSVKLVRERRNYHWLYTSSEGWTSDYTERHYTVANKVVSVKADAGVNLSFAVDWGYYRLEVTNPETGVVAGYKFRAGWDADETAMAGRPDRIGLALNKKHYKAGDTVSVEIKAPAAGKGYLLVESDKTLYKQLIDIPKAGQTVSFAFQEEWNRHDLYVSVLLVQPGADREEKLPRRMMGIAPLRLDREDRELKVEISATQKIRPNRQLIVPIKVSSALGTKLQGPVQVTLAAVDVGILNISRFETPDPHQGFFQQRAYGTKLRDNYSDLIDAQEGVIAQLKFGGDSDGVQAGEADPDVQIVSLFSGVVEVDENGEANVALSIPDFNGRIRLMAIAFSAHEFGASEQDIEVAAPIVAQLTKPRLMRAGDQSQLALDLNNLSGFEQNVGIQIALGEGLRFKLPVGEQAQAQEQKLRVTLKKNEKKILFLPIVADANYRSVEIDMRVTGINLDATESTHSMLRQWLLPVKPAWAKTDRQWQKFLSEDERFELPANALDDLIEHELAGTLSISNQPPLDIASHLSALKAYPYGCLEQTTSGVFPQLYINDDLLKALNIKGSDLEQRNAAIKIAIQRLQGMQRGNGGFGLWSDQSPEEHWLSVYVTDFLLRAQTAGHQVPAKNLKKAIARLSTYLRSPNKISSYRDSINKENKFSIRAYAAQVLVSINQAPLSVLRNMFDRRDGEDTPMALLQLGLALQKAGDQARAQKAIGEASLRVDEFGSDSVHYSSEVRDLALSGFWLLEAKQPAKYWEPLLLEIVEQLRSRQWLSTQERNALFLLGKELQKVQGEKVGVSWSIAGKSFEKELSRLQVVLTSRDLQGAISVENYGENGAYINLRASGYQTEPPAAMNNQLQVDRNFYDINGDRFDEREIRSGEKLIVELAVHSEQRLRHALLVDLLPAGLEIENQNLADSYDQKSLLVNGEEISDLMYNLNIAHQEYRDDRFVMALDLPKKRLVKVYYLVRAVSPGVFTIPPTFAEDMYRPEIRHQGEEAGVLTILPR